MKNQVTFCSTKTRRYLIVNCLALLISLILLFPARSYCQEEVEYDEMIISLNSRIVGSAEIPAIIYDQQAYLPVNDLFDFLKLNNSFSKNNDSLSGFILNSNDVFSISKAGNSISYKSEVISLPSGTIFYKLDDYYLRTDYFGSIFNLNCDFSFRSLTVTFDTGLELPFMREQRQQQMRLNLKNLKDQPTADTIIKNKFAFLKAGMLDWDVSSSQAKGQKSYAARVGIGLGLLGGEANIFLNYNSQQAIDLKNQNYYWRYVNHDAALVKQFTAGRVNAPGAFSLYAPLNGVQISNSSLRPKKSFGSFLVNDRTEPNWIVELYVNDAMVNYTKADANGLFSFEVPMIYGTCNIRYKFYGPFGEVKEISQQINIPFTFLQPGSLEYNLTAGVTNDNEHHKYSRLNLNYGLAKRITIGSAVEYNSQAGINNLMPMLTASLRLVSNLIVSAEHAPGIVSRANANYRFKGNLQVEASMIKYAESQTVIRTANLGEKRISLSMPFRFKKWGGFSRLIYNEVDLYKGRQKNAEWMMAASFKGVNANISTSALMLKPDYMQSKLALSFKGPLATRISPQVQYQHNNNEIAVWKIDAEKRIGKQAILNVSYDYNKQFQSSGVTVNWRHDLSFMQLGGNMRHQDKSLYSSQYAGGSLFLSGGAVNASSQKNVGTGGITIEAFLDKNYNGKKDVGEEGVIAPRVKADGAQIKKDKNSSTVTLTGLEPFETYLVTLEEGNFENPSWRIEKKLLEISVEPNAFKKIDIPVMVAGEVAGYVYEQSINKKEGIGRVKLNVYDAQKKLVTKLITEPDGYFSYLGLKAGEYSISVDAGYLEKEGKLQIKTSNNFTMQYRQEGDIVDNVEIIITTKEK